MAQTIQEAARQIAVKRGLILPETDKSLWPAPYDEWTPEATYRFLIDCIWTFDESTGEDRPMPDKEYLRLIVDEFHECERTGTQLHCVKSRRLVVSWAFGAIELHKAGLKRGIYMIAAESFEGNNGSCAFVWRQEYLYRQLRARFNDWNLPQATASGGKGEGEVEKFVLPNGSRFIAGNSDPRKFQGSGAGYMRVEEASKYKELEKIIAQAATNLEAPTGVPDVVGGLLVTVSNADANPAFLELMEPHDGERLLSYGVARARNNKQGKRVLEIHYAADKDKDADWAAERKKDIPLRQWMREYEGEINAHDGEAVWPEYRNDIHRWREPLAFPKLNNVGWLVAGWDCGNTGNPAFVLGHILPMPDQQIQILMEVLPDAPMAMESFAGLVAERLSEEWPGWRAFQISHQADPSGMNFQGNIGRSAFDIARDKGFVLRPSSNALDQRIGDVAWALSDWMVEGEVPRIIFDGTRCPVTIGAVGGGYAWRTSGGAGGYRVLHEPRKDGWSHPADALEYLIMRARAIIQGRAAVNATIRQRGHNNRRRS